MLVIRRSITGFAARLSLPSASQGSGNTTGPRHCAAQMGYTCSGTPRYTTPLPDRTAAFAASTAAPVSPVLPHSSSTLP